MDAEEMESLYGEPLKYDVDERMAREISKELSLNEILSVYKGIVHLPLFVYGIEAVMLYFIPDWICKKSMQLYNYTPPFTWLVSATLLIIGFWALNNYGIVRNLNRCVEVIGRAACFNKRVAFGRQFLKDMSEAAKESLKEK